MAVLEAHTGRYEVGHSPSNPADLVTAMRTDGFTHDELVDAGLAHRYANGRITDFYRQRVLIPIRDQQSRICGFVGRNVGDDRWPKYKNPPRTHAYDKSVNLYQPLPAPTGTWSQVVVVEGTLDAMAIAVVAIGSGVAGRFCPVTQSGRELSATQLEQVASLHGGAVVLGFDGDTAGRESAHRHAMERSAWVMPCRSQPCPAIMTPLPGWRREVPMGLRRGWAAQLLTGVVCRRFLLEPTLPLAEHPSTTYPTQRLWRLPTDQCCDYPGRDPRR